MTSVPKPLKYLRQHFSPLKEIYDTWGDGENKVQYMYLFSGLFKFMFYFSLQAFRSNLVNMLRGGRIILYSVPVSTFLETCGIFIKCLKTSEKCSEDFWCLEPPQKRFCPQVKLHVHDCTRCYYVYVIIYLSKLENLCQAWCQCDLHGIFFFPSWHFSWTYMYM